VKTHADPGEAAPRRGSRWVVDVAILTGALLALVAATLAARWAWTPTPGPEEQVSCAPYGLEDVRTAPRGEARPLSTGPVLSGGLRWAEGTSDRLDVPFEHEGTTSSYHVFADGIDWSEPVGVVFRLHGDGAYEYEHPEHKVSCLAEVARSHNAVLVAPRTPDRQGEPTWWEDLDGNAEWFLALAEQRIFAEYDLDRSRTWLHGYSGGAEFISYELLADRADFLQGGGAVLSGGGGAPSTGTSEPTQEQLEQLVLHWDVGLEDDGTDPWAPFDALSAAAAGHAWYEDAGWARTSVRYREGVDHFELPEARVLDAAMTAGESPAERSAELSPDPSAGPPRGPAADGRD
jgi:poly(3-hydroxybutyrate) depolymerase